MVALDRYKSRLSREVVSGSVSPETSSLAPIRALRTLVGQELA